MGTLVTIHVVRPHADDAIERAFGWFREIERDVLGSTSRAS